MLPPECSRLSAFHFKSAYEKEQRLGSSAHYYLASVGGYLPEVAVRNWGIGGISYRTWFNWPLGSNNNDCH